LAGRSFNHDQEAELSLLGRPHIRRPASDFRSQKDSDFPQWLYSLISAMVKLLYQTLQFALGYDTVIGRTYGWWLQAATMHSKLRPNRCS